MLVACRGSPEWVIVPGLPHHITQRGNRRQRTFFSAGDYQAYVDLMADWSAVGDRANAVGELLRRGYDRFIVIRNSALVLTFCRRLRSSSTASTAFMSLRTRRNR